MSRNRTRETAHDPPLTLFPSQPALPSGLRYHPDFIAIEEESELLDQIGRLELCAVRMHGVTARRRVKHFGWLYGYESWKIQPGPPLPDFLAPVRRRAAALIGLNDPARLEEVLITEYQPGAGIGWHRDAPMFGDAVVGISLGGACRLRFRRGKVRQRESADLILGPRSAYVLAGAARTEWQHSIPAVASLRYSITFRTLRTGEDRHETGNAV